MDVLDIEDENFEEEVLQSKLPVLVDFWAAWCMPCRMVGPIVEELAKDYAGKIKVGKMNVDENSKTPASYGIMSIPTLILFNKGNPQKTLIGVQPKEVFKKSIDEVLGN